MDQAERDIKERRLKYLMPSPGTFIDEERTEDGGSSKNLVRGRDR